MLQESGGEPKKVEGAHHAHRQSHHGIDGKSGVYLFDLWS